MQLFHILFVTKQGTGLSGDKFEDMVGGCGLGGAYNHVKGYYPIVHIKLDQY